MADISITAASVVAASSAKTTAGVAGETITAGMAVYLASSGKWMNSDADAATAAGRSVHGIALNSASLNQPLGVLKSGDITIGATLTANTAYYLSGATAGGICPLADVGTGEYLVLIGIAKSASLLAVNIQATGVAN